MWILWYEVYIKEYTIDSQENSSFSQICHLLWIVWREVRNKTYKFLAPINQFHLFTDSTTRISITHILELSTLERSHLFVINQNVEKVRKISQKSNEILNKSLVYSFPQQSIFVLPQNPGSSWCSYMWNLCKGNQGFEIPHEESYW